MKKSYPLKPLYDKNSEILILGSYPGEMSISNGFYYADNRNQFWNLLSDIFNETVPNNTIEREKFLKKHHIALWDVCEIVDRDKSNDKSLKPIKINKIETILKPRSKIKTILCNGKTAYKLFRKYNEELDCKLLISSSGGANAYIQERKEQWKDALLGKKK